MTDAAAGGARVSLTHLPWKTGFVEASPVCREGEAMPDPGSSQILVAR